MRDEDEKLTVLVGVREYAEEFEVELWRDAGSGRLVIQARNEGGFNITQVDLLDVLNLFKASPKGLQAMLIADADNVIKDRIIMLENLLADHHKFQCNTNSEYGDSSLFDKTSDALAS